MRRIVISLLMVLVPLLCMNARPETVSYYQYAVTLDTKVSAETGKVPVAHLWIPEGVAHVRAVLLAQQNMTEERILKMDVFREEMRRTGVALVWVAPMFTQSWDPQSDCQQVFEKMMSDLAAVSGHDEIGHMPVIPLGHSAQATFPWNFAAWNPDRTLCIISFHGDAPRTNLCGYGLSNVEWGRQRNIDGIPGLIVEGEYEWWEARVRPALAFQMMYPESVISFLCDTGRSHFDCGEATALYIAKFIEKSMAMRLKDDGSLRKVKRSEGWLACRYRADLPENDGDGKGPGVYDGKGYAPVAPYAEYKGDVHDAFWYPDEEMARLTEQRYSESRGKKVQYVGLEYEGRLVATDPYAQTGMCITFRSHDKDGITIRLKGVYTDKSRVVRTGEHGSKKPHIEVISGPICQTGDDTFRLYPYEAGWDNARRSLTCTLAVVADADEDYRGCVQPFTVIVPKELVSKIK